MQRPSAQEFLLKVLETLEDLPPDFTRRLAEVLKQPETDRALALRRFFEDFAGD
jgi:hypothetical protein